LVAAFSEAQLRLNYGSFEILQVVYLRSILRDFPCKS